MVKDRGDMAGAPALSIVQNASGRMWSRIFLEQNHENGFAPLTTGQATWPNICTQAIQGDSIKSQNLPPLKANNTASLFFSRKHDAEADEMTTDCQPDESVGRPPGHITWLRALVQGSGSPICGTRIPRGTLRTSLGYANSKSVMADTRKGIKKAA
ncbi:hypothetical protein AVEN_24238-1 [Araneus ventricosus]|uniref:Uncharacterized protein n=1 Tax=Araneus ventricosus TaxID=182803 RepID=A0A4Y2G2U5_ARAVE|nr:hypothetical protein AVEN_24238-1 [Araneus ventricosus]